MKSKRTKATDITPKTKAAVWARDGQRCIFCGSGTAMPNAHVIPRSHGGLGVEKNIVTACTRCHYEMDHTVHRPIYIERAKAYLLTIYSAWNEQELIYRKW